MAINKKAVFFSLSSLVIIGSLFIMFSVDITRNVDFQQRVQEFPQDKAVLEEQVISSLIGVYARQAINEVARTAPHNQEDIHELLAECLGSKYEEKIDHNKRDEAVIRCSNTDLSDNFITRTQEIISLYKNVSLYEVDFQIQNIHLEPHFHNPSKQGLKLSYNGLVFLRADDQN